MKKLSFLAAGLLVSTLGFSQISIDPEIGINISNSTLKIDGEDAIKGDAIIGLRAGAGVNIDLYKGLYLRPGVFYSMMGDKGDAFGPNATRTLHYLQVPVNIGYRHTFNERVGGVFAEVGPYVGYALAGTTKVDGASEKENIDFGTDVMEMNPLDWGFNFGVGYQSPWGLYLRGSYGLGLGNMSNIDDVKLTNNAFNISLGYRITL